MKAKSVLDQWLGNSAGEAFARLDAAYGDKGRAYHGWAHIEGMLAELEAARAQPEFGDLPFDVMALAVVYHDAVYDPRRNDNEAMSARMLERDASKAGVDSGTVAHAASMIEATASHRPSDDLATQLLLDIDLAVLGSPSGTYDAYVGAVRREYAFVPDDAWRSGRAAVMTRFLDREKLYGTLAYARLEPAARCNIRREIAALQGTAPS